MMEISAKVVCMTTSWDDGHPLDQRVADLLAKYDLQGTFYIPVETERGILTRDQIRQLSNIFEIGAHTLHHVNLTSLPDQLARKEIFESKQWVEDVTGKPCLTFCFPMGKFRKKHLAFVKNAGYVAARSVELMSIDFPRHESGILIMPTTVQAFPHTPLNYLRNIAKRVTYRSLMNYVIHTRRWDSNWVRIAESLLGRAITCGGVFHLWGHSWEIEEYNQWQQLEEVFNLMSEYKKQALYLTNLEVCNYA